MYLHTLLFFPDNGVDFDIDLVTHHRRICRHVEGASPDLRRRNEFP